MKSKFTKMMNISLITSILFIILGIVMFILPNNKLDTLALVITGIFIFYGGANMIDDYKEFKPFYFFDGFTSGLLSIILGTIIVLNRDASLIVVLPIIVGIWFIISSTFKLRMSLALKDTNNKAWVLTYILSLVTIAIGLLIIINPTIGNITISKVLAAAFILFSIIDIIEVYLFKKNIKAIVRVFE